MGIIIHENTREKKKKDEKTMKHDEVTKTRHRKKKKRKRENKRTHTGRSDPIRPSFLNQRQITVASGTAPSLAGNPSA